MGAEKGSNYERDLARKLSLWWSDGQNENIFWRCSSSGARFTTSKQIITNSAGDLGYLDSCGKPFIDLIVHEAKCGYTDKVRKDSDKIKELLSKIKSGSDISEKDILKVLSVKKGGFDITDIFQNKKSSVFTEWLRKLKEDTTKSGRFSGILYIKRDSKPELVVVERALLSDLEQYALKIMKKKMTIEFDLFGENDIFFTYDIFTFDDFFNHFHKEDFTALYEAWRAK